MDTVKFVEELSSAHQRKTRQSVFLEHYPEAAIDAYGLLRICPTYISAEYRCRMPCLTEIRCTDCRREFWMQEV